MVNERLTTSRHQFFVKEPIAIVHFAKGFISDASWRRVSPFEGFAVGMDPPLTAVTTCRKGTLSLSSTQVAPVQLS